MSYDIANQIMLREYKEKYHYLCDQQKASLLANLNCSALQQHTVHNRLCGESSEVLVVLDDDVHNHCKNNNLTDKKHKVYFSLDQCAISICSGSLLAKLAQHLPPNVLHDTVKHLTLLGMNQDSDHYLESRRSREYLIDILLDGQAPQQIIKDFISLSTLIDAYPLRKNCFSLNLRGYLHCVSDGTHSVSDSVSDENIA
ncbi:MAG: hypothetical protein OXC44_05950 [Proteobacteria bacterium]|nr:hypothetical protein [Pseudomonadota bacterium]